MAHQIKHSYGAYRGALALSNKIPSFASAGHEVRMACGKRIFGRSAADSYRLNGPPPTDPVVGYGLHH